MWFLKKNLSLFGVLFLLSFNQSTLWNLKDSLLVTTAGAEVIPFIKVWVILPSVAFFMWIYTLFSYRFSQKKVFYILTSFFLLFYTAFAFLIYPNRDLFHPVESAAYLDSILPAGFKGLVAMYRHWTLAGFYVMCELWNTVVISVLFWGYANATTRYSESGRLYSCLSLIYNVAIIFAGMFTVFFAKSHFFDNWENHFKFIVAVVVGSGLLAMALFRGGNCREERKRARFSLLESVRYVGKSRYLTSIAVMVVGYSLAINLVEVIWKDQLSQLFPATMEYNAFISQLQIVQGVVSVLISLGLAWVIGRFGWRKIALVTPILMLCFSALFFGSLLFRSSLLLTVLFGSVLNCLSKSCKFSLFDTTKEMAFVPLDGESQIKGKISIDGIGARLGKSGSSLIHQGLLVFFASFSASAPFIGAVLLPIFVCWILCTRQLGKENNLLLQT